MTFFKPFPQITYKFGNETTLDVFQNISIYADVVDQLIDDVAAYDDYYVRPGERPDQVSYNLYDTEDYYWTFFLVNPILRESGWPLAPGKLDEHARKIYNKDIIITRSKLTDKFKLNQTITGQSSGATGTIDHRNLDLGQLWLKNVTGKFTNGETIQSTNSDGVIETVVVQSVDKQYNTPHHYEDASKNHVDIDPEVGPGALLTAVTWLDNLNSFNDTARQIRVLKKARVEEVVSSFRKAIRS